jgi:hypothetical protein
MLGNFYVHDFLIFITNFHYNLDDIEKINNTLGAKQKMHHTIPKLASGFDVFDQSFVERQPPRL